MEFNFYLLAVILTVTTQLATPTSSASVIVSQRDQYDVSPVSELLSEGMKLALKNCQRQFQYETWNCPKKDFLAKQQNPTMDRESAFVQAITVAAIAYTVAKNCTKQKSSFCGCAFKESNAVEDIYDCFMNIRNVEHELSQVIVQLSGEDAAYDPQGMMFVQNSRAGLFTVMNYIQTSCRCAAVRDQFLVPAFFLFPESVMNSIHKKCRCQDFHFDKIARDLKHMYLFAEPLDTSNNMNMNHFVPTEGEIVYLNESPNYCGTVRGRVCATSKSTETEQGACKELCGECGLRMRWKEVTTSRSCNCTFNWNPPMVKCDMCDEVSKEFYCS